LNDIHPINRVLIKLRKLLELIQVHLCYPDFNKPNLFHLDTDASDHQLREIIMEDKKPLSIYSRKLNAAQRLYTTTERDLLSAIETCKEYKNILIEYQKLIIVSMDKNNNFNGLKASDHVLRFLLFLE
jgi:hypothetical protein